MTDVVLEQAVAWIASGGIVAYPTETVWGLGADARNETALDRLRAFKGRADAAPISILVTGVGALAGLGFHVDAAAQRLAREFWPGPITLVLPCAGAFAAGIARADGAVGVRCSPHAVARELAARCERAEVGPVTATSCNSSGAPAARTREAARRVCGADRALHVISDGPDVGGAQASTVVDLTGARPRVLRWGALSEATLRPVLDELAA
jgi:tRNA threonylcarbamoyl adenosine modification protein (Sua5/YciO/YrdC/YwlC family)